jgi:hypothetical protein
VVDSLAVEEDTLAVVVNLATVVDTLAVVNNLAEENTVGIEDKTKVPGGR